MVLVLHNDITHPGYVVKIGTVIPLVNRSNSRHLRAVWWSPRYLSSQPIRAIHELGR